MERYLTNKDTLRRLIYESIYHALCESSQDKTALTYLKSRGINDYNEQMKYIGSLQHDIPNLRLDKRKFMTGALRMYFEGELSNYDNIDSFNKVLNCISKHGYTGDYNFDLNGLSLSELYNKHEEEIRTDAETDRERSGHTQRGNGNGYNIIPINSFEEAEQYGKYTIWCVTKDIEQFDHYTKGGKRFYFCLQDGFESVERNDNGAPLNEYGLSMIAVLVDSDGNLCQITTRYNHDYDGENNRGLRTVEQLEDVLDVNFYQVFKPYTRDELHEMGIIPFDEVQELLDSGKKPSEVFDYFGDFHEGLFRVKLNGKYNYIDENNKLLSNQWFDYCFNFSEGFASVQLGEKGNYINTNGEILLDKWFDGCGDFYNGFAQVLLNNVCNYINTNGELLSPNQWFDDGYKFSEGFARVKVGKKWNYISTNGELLSPNKWFEGCGDFHDGFGGVKLNGKYNYIDKNNKLLSKIWFDYCDNFHYGVARVNLGEKWNYINTNGEIISPNQWFDYCDDFYNGFAIVKVGKKWNFIDKNGELLSQNQWFDGCSDFSNGVARVMLNNKYNYIKTNGELLSPYRWFDFCNDFNEGFAIVKLGKKWNYINTRCELLSPDQWFDYCHEFYDGFAQVKFNNEWKQINKYGEIFNK